MKTPYGKMLIVLFAVLAVAALAATDAGSQVNAMSGKSKLTYTKKEVVPVGDVEGHIFMMGEASGVNANTGKWAVRTGRRPEVSASRTHQATASDGYFILSKDGNETVSKVTGTIKTRALAGGQAANDNVWRVEGS